MARLLPEPRGGVWSPSAVGGPPPLAARPRSTATCLRAWRGGLACRAAPPGGASDGDTAAPAAAVWPPQPTAAPPRGAPAACRLCGGTRVTGSAAAGTLAPCPACVPWRRSPDYAPGRPLLRASDLDLSALGDGGADGADAAAAASAPADGADADSGSSSSGDEDGRRRRRGPMPPRQRQAISAALRDRGPLPPEHRRSIARAMREAHLRDPSLRRGGAGRPKSCSHCGGAGHNRRSCPQLAAARAGAAAAAAPPPAAAEPVDAAAALGGVQQQGEEELQQPQQAELEEAGASAVALAAAAAAPAAPAAPPPAPLAAELVFPLPRTADECVRQAEAAVLRAWEDGVRRQWVELLLPEPGAPRGYAPASRGGYAGGWPGGIRQQFRVARPLVEALLLRLKAHPGLGGRVTGELLDEGDCVAAWQSERLAAVLFPTGESLPELLRIDDALSGRRLTLVINPQWQPRGQWVGSDFGFGAARRRAERYVASLEPTYRLRRVRVAGDEVRLLRAYPARWQVHVVLPGGAGGGGGGGGAGAGAEGGGAPALVAAEDEEPGYARLVDVLKRVPGTAASKSWVERLGLAAAGGGGGGGGDGGAPGAGGSPGGSLDDDGAERDIVTGARLPRDYRAEPAAQLARWLGKR